MDEQMKKWVLQSASDETYLKMTEEEFEERITRLDFKRLNGIMDEEVIAANERGYRNTELLVKKLMQMKKAKFLAIDNA